MGRRYRSTAQSAGPAAPAGGVTNIHVKLMPYVPGQTSWRHTGPGLTLTARLTTASPRVGEPVQLDVMLSSTEASCCVVMLLPGDQPRIEQRYSCTPGQPAGSGPVTVRLTHTYATVGRFQFTVGGATGTCAAPRAAASFAASIDVV